MFGCSKNSEKIFIAHGGGAIDGIEYTNSKEAVENALAKGISYIEDLALTSDSVLVASHDWHTFRILTGNSVLNDEPLSLREFKNSKIANKFTPLTADDITTLLTQHPQMHLVSDKISDPGILNRYFSEFSDRVMVKCFSIDDYYELKNINRRGYNKFLVLDKDVQVRIDPEKILEDECWDGLKSYITNTHVFGSYNNKQFRMMVKFLDNGKYEVKYQEIDKK